MLNYNRARWFVVVPLVAVTSVGLIAAARPEPLSGCQTVAQWVQEHKAELPRTYAEMIRYPWQYRKAIQPLLPMNVRREMWHSQYRIFRESGLLNSAQAAFVARAERTIDELLDERSTEQRRIQLGDSVVTRALDILGRDLTHQIFFSLGPDDAGTLSTSSSIGTPSVFQFAANHPIALPSPRFDNCVCHWMSDGISPPECPDGDCHDTDCTPPQIGGCGPDGNLACNSRCHD